MLFRRRRSSARLPESAFLKRAALLIYRSWYDVRIDLGTDDPAGGLRYIVALIPPTRLLTAAFVFAFWSRRGKVWGLKVGKPTGHVELAVIFTHWWYIHYR